MLQISSKVLDEKNAECHGIGQSPAAAKSVLTFGGIDFNILIWASRTLIIYYYAIIYFF